MPQPRERKPRTTVRANQPRVFPWPRRALHLARRRLRRRLPDQPRAWPRPRCPGGASATDLSLGGKPQAAP